LAALAALAAFFLATSWRKWTEPLIDFGRELYLPWRLSNGALLYRDADDFYGPLSQYFNACLFRLLGPGLMVLAAANIIIFAAILALIYTLFRRAWGAGAALASSAVFVGVFGFSVVHGGNYNFVTPYSHEATHGFLVCLLVVHALARWLERPTAAGAALAGFLFGLTVVLKPEIMLSAALVSAAAMVVVRRQPRTAAVPQAAAWLAAAALPTLLFWGFFAAHVPLKDAFLFASRAWLNVAATDRFTGDYVQSAFLGFDHPWANLVQHLEATLIAAATIAGLAAAAMLVDRVASAPVRVMAAAALMAAVVWLGWERILWFHTGRCLLGLVLAYLCCTLSQPALGPADGKEASRRALRLMLGVLAAAMMSRMLLNGRIIQFGFYQAALAAILLPAAMIGELADRLRLGRWGRATLAAATLGMAATATITVAVQSQENLRRKTNPVGVGVDRFYSYPRQIDATGEIVNAVSEKLAELPRGRTLVVLPEGEMINYLARMPSPVAPFFFFSAATRGDLEPAIVSELQKHPPDWVVIISRDLRDYGIERYGRHPGEGRQILDWASPNYGIVYAIGGDPFEPEQRGALVLSRQ
jgi:hypothetical protein